MRLVRENTKILAIKFVRSNRREIWSSTVV